MQRIVLTSVAFGTVYLFEHDSASSLSGVLHCPPVWHLCVCLTHLTHICCGRCVQHLLFACDSFSDLPTGGSWPIRRSGFTLPHHLALFRTADVSGSTSPLCVSKLFCVVLILSLRWCVLMQQPAGMYQQPMVSCWWLTP